VGDAAERAVAADDDGGLDRVREAFPLCRLGLLGEDGDVVAMGDQVLLELTGDRLAPAAAGDRIGEDQDLLHALTIPAGARAAQ
jgi:hypothetical protein